MSILKNKWVLSVLATLIYIGIIIMIGGKNWVLFVGVFSAALLFNSWVFEGRKLQKLLIASFFVLALVWVFVALNNPEKEAMAYLSVLYFAVGSFLFHAISFDFKGFADFIKDIRRAKNGESKPAG